MYSMLVSVYIHGFFSHVPRFQPMVIIRWEVPPPPMLDPSIRGPNSHPLVAPYGADIDTTYHGSVQYMGFDRFSPNSARVSSFIN